MTVQFDLLGEPVGLTERQLAAVELLNLHRAGLSAETVGAHWHGLRGKHASYAPCQWCATDGRAVLVELRAKGWTTQRRNPTRWELTRAALAALPAPPGTGPGALPEDF